MASTAARSAMGETGGVARAHWRELNAARGVVNMPSRAIAAVLLKAKSPMPRDELFEQASEYGMFNSKRHFKHVLKMMKKQNRIRMLCKGPEYPGSSKLAFEVALTRRGDTIYTRYLGNEIPPPIDQDPPSLANATP